MSYIKYVARTSVLPETRDDLRERLGCYLLIAVWLAIILPLITLPWFLLWRFGPVHSIIAAVLAHPVWLLVAGIPAPASGSKPASCGWMLIVFSTIPAVIVDLVLIVNEFFR